MQLKSLKVFCDVVGRRSFSRAADENGISQSGASQMVHQLEDHLGVKLIDRSKRPFVLTPEGKIYYEGCRKLVKRFDALEEEVRTFHDEVGGRVTVASIYSVGLSHMNQIVQDFLRRYPKANVNLQYQHPDRVYQLVENNLVDLGLVSYPRDSRSLRTIAWRKEPIVVVCSPQHPLASCGNIELKALDGLDFIGFADGLRIRHETDRILASQGVHVRVVMEFDNIETLKRAIEINAGVSLLPEPTVCRELAEGTLTTISLEGTRLCRPLGIIHRRGAELGKSARRFIDLLREESVDPGKATSAAHCEASHEAAPALQAHPSAR